MKVFSDEHSNIELTFCLAGNVDLRVAEERRNTLQMSFTNENPLFFTFWTIPNRWKEENVQHERRRLTILIMMMSR